LLRTIGNRLLAFPEEKLRFVSRHVLLTGFEPFGAHPVNPSELLVRSLEGRVIGGRAVDVRVFPVETRTLRDRIETALHEVQPQIVIGTGYAPGRAALGVERVGLNVLDFDIPDASGAMRKNDPVERGGPDARLSTLPLAEIVAAWTAAGVPGYVSDSAGTYLCNQWLYDVLALTANASTPVLAGFVHVPALPAQAVQLGAERTPSMTLELMRRGLETAIEAISLSLETKPAPSPRTGEAMWIPSGRRDVER
jgi:pyroglutamyl-peptidase